MKPYFSKLLTEQERAGSRNPSRKWGGRVKYNPDPEFDYEDEITRVSMSRHGMQYGWNGKSLTDVLSPLYGYLEKNVGRHWDDVYSELSKGLDRRSVSGLHVFSHLWDYVDRHTVMCEDGKVRAWAGGRWGGGRLTEPDDFYVHPYTGILKKAPDRPNWWRRRGKKDKDTDEHLIWIAESKQYGESYKRIDGIWYQVEWTMKDVVTGYHPIRLSWGSNPWNVKQEVQVLKKRQLGRKELKHLGLVNIII